LREDRKRGNIIDCHRISYYIHPTDIFSRADSYNRS
jgi:hypothetical protein